MRLARGRGPGGWAHRKQQAKPCFLYNSERQQATGGIQVRTSSLNAMEPGPKETTESRAASAGGRHGKSTRHSGEGLC